MSRRGWAVVSAVLVAVAVSLFLLGATNRAGGLLGADNAYHALQQTFVLTLIASACGIAAIITTALAVGRRR